MDVAPDDQNLINEPTLKNFTICMTDTVSSGIPLMIADLPQSDRLLVDCEHLMMANSTLG